MEENNYLLLVIDPQNDFCDPEGALYLPGAQEDMLRLAQFISQHQDEISQIIITRDEHQLIDISHPAFWFNEQGDMPSPFTPITHQDVVGKKWFPVFMAQEVIDYLEELERNGDKHVVWPEHCLAGAWGAAFNDDVMDAVSDWARGGCFYTVVSKGQNPLVEHSGAIRANVVQQEDPSTQVNQRLVEELAMAQTIVVAGQARNHSVANTLKQMLEQPSIQGEIIVLTDCMSDLPGFGHCVDSIFEMACARGVKFVSTDSFGGGAMD